MVPPPVNALAVDPGGELNGFVTITGAKKAKLDAFLAEEKKWSAEIARLREITAASGLEEDIKWGKPCYTLNGKNVIIIIPFKDSCALAFMKGALLKDTKRLLASAGENSQSNKWIKFNSVREIDRIKPTLEAYIQEAIENEKAGREVSYRKTDEYPVPQELKNAFKRAPRLKAAYQALTPGRQRGYLIYFAAAKQSATRDARIVKCTPKILEGKGLLEDYHARGKS
ncbi:MAG TPA: DUF1801 domain-containing protein [Opitutaceae bacterium]